MLTFNTFKPDVSSAEVPKSNFSPPTYINTSDLRALLIISGISNCYVTHPPPSWPLEVSPCDQFWSQPARMILHLKGSNTQSTKFLNCFCWWSVIICKKKDVDIYRNKWVPISAIALALFNSSAIVRVTSGLSIMMSRFTKRSRRVDYFGWGAWDSNFQVLSSPRSLLPSRDLQQRIEYF